MGHFYLLPRSTNDPLLSVMSYYKWIALGLNCPHMSCDKRKGVLGPYGNSKCPDQPAKLHNLHVTSITQTRLFKYIENLTSKN